MPAFRAEVEERFRDLRDRIVSRLEELEGGAKFRRIEDLERGAVTGQLAGEGAHTVTTQLDRDAAVLLGWADANASAERPSQHRKDVGLRTSGGGDGRAAALDLVGDEPPRLLQVEPVGTAHRQRRRRPVHPPGDAVHHADGRAADLEVVVVVGLQFGQWCGVPV